ncbi:hypothetical protein [Streptomyces sp. NPDC049585]|uniref:hypothetical protein n=1 Tax=Streptomyces sp. NPDC049585 TaxID=3155154 RepID=UPI00341ACCC5
MAVKKVRWPKLDPDSGVEDATLLILEWLGEQGVDALIRVDAERIQAGQPAWTFVASGGQLADAVRTDGVSAAECMGRALFTLREAGLSVPF